MIFIHQNKFKIDVVYIQNGKASHPSVCEIYCMHTNTLVIVSVVTGTPDKSSCVIRGQVVVKHKYIYILCIASILNHNSHAVWRLRHQQLIAAQELSNVTFLQPLRKVNSEKSWICKTFRDLKCMGIIPARRSPGIESLLFRRCNSIYFVLFQFYVV